MELNEREIELLDYALACLIANVGNDEIDHLGNTGLDMSGETELSDEEEETIRKAGEKLEDELAVLQRKVSPLAGQLADPDKDEFECTICHKVFDIEDSIKVNGDLVCPDCAK